MNQQKIGKFISERRKIKNLTQMELAEKLGVSNRTISKWENGNSLPDYSIIHNLCEVLDISINELLSGEELTKENYQKKLEENIVSTIDYNNKKRNKRIRKFIIFIVVIALIYILYKTFIAYVYYADHTVHEDNTFPINKNIETVKIKNNRMANQKVLDNNLNMYIPVGFELVTDRAKSNFVVPDCEPYIKGLKDKDNFDAMILICHNPIDISNMEKLGIHNTILPWMDTYSLLKKYNIHDSLDLIKFYEEHNDFNPNLFTSSDDIKINYIARNYSTLTIGAYENFYYLENDLKGYTIEYLKNEGKTYFNQTVITFPAPHGIFGESKYGITFTQGKEEYFNHDNTFEIINSISKIE